MSSQYQNHHEILDGLVAKGWFRIFAYQPELTICFVVIKYRLYKLSEAPAEIGSIKANGIVFPLE